MADLTMKPCPFCGRKPVLDMLMACTGDFWRVICNYKSCGVEGPFRKTERNAIKAWNRRDGEGKLLRYS